MSKLISSFIVISREEKGDRKSQSSISDLRYHYQDDPVGQELLSSARETGRHGLPLRETIKLEKGGGLKLTGKRRGWMGGCNKLCVLAC